MTNSEIKKVLLNNGVQHLYHANTVETSLSFFKCGGLLSRGLCQDMGLPQTSQYTDISDKIYHTFYDIFFDSIEIQRRTGYSSYGPVLFQYNLNVLDTINEGHIRITKMNPDKWKNTVNNNERYFLELDELTLLYDKNDFGQHITLVDQKQPLSFKYLERIVLSNPQKDNNLLFNVARDTINQVINVNKLNMQLIIRDYGYNKRFFDAYASQNKLCEHFSLGGHNK